MVICLTGFLCKEAVVRETLFHRIFFILCAEVLAEKVRNNTRLKGILVTDSEFKLSQYANDITFLLDGSEDSSRPSLLTLKLYASFSGLDITWSKLK